MARKSGTVRYNAMAKHPEALMRNGEAGRDYSSVMARLGLALQWLRAAHYCQGIACFISVKEQLCHDSQCDGSVMLVMVCNGVDLRRIAMVWLCYVVQW